MAPCTLGVERRMRILILNGVNLNMFGRRDPVQYGHASLEDIKIALEELALELGCELVFFQTNSESEMLGRIHATLDEDIDAIVINAGAWTHYNYALADALAICHIPIVEVHMSNIFAREQFRHFSVISPLARGCIAGFGVESYLLGLRAAYAAAKKGNCP